MNRSLTAAITGLAMLTAGAAGAADLRRDALPPAPELPPLFSWTGLHLGVQAGYAWGRTRLSGVPAVLRDDSGAALGGAHLGFDYQLGGIVLGAEGDVEALNQTSRLDGVALSGRIRQDWQASLRARLGLAFDRFLIYGTGGAAFTEIERQTFATATGLAERATASRTGWTAGAGINFAMTDNVILGLEYRYTDFGKASFGPSLVLPGVAGEYEARSHIGRASLGYKF
ncbi:MAG: porin family protein [Chelatococcus sp.]|nr:MAG: porin family protein [Chelatococcus sp.]